MNRIALFFLPPAVIALALQAAGVGWVPQQQAVTQAAAWITRTVCPSHR